MEATAIRQRDERLAQEFYHTPQAPSLVAKYVEELDSELRGDMVKTALYCTYRESGMDAVFASMNACRRAPGAANIDRHFSEKARYRMNRMSQKNLDRMVEIARKAGVSTQGRFYVGGLGRYTDQSAWVSHADDVLASARMKNLNVSGAVNHQARETPPPAPVPLAPDIVQEKVRRILATEPATAEKVRKNPGKINELKERVISTHAKKGLRNAKIAS